MAAEEELPTLCPGCCPDEDFKYAAVQWCGQHQPSREGSEDRVASPLAEYGVIMLNEAGGEENRMACDVVHRGRNGRDG